MVPSHSSNDIVLLLRPLNGSIILLDFGTLMTEPPGGLKPNQVVDVVAVLEQGELHTLVTRTEMLLMKVAK